MSASRCLLAVLLLALLVPPRAAGQSWEDYDYENLEFRGLGLEFGGLIPAKVDRTAYFGARADLGYVGPHIRILPALRLWASQLDQNEVDRLEAQILRICERQVTQPCPSALDLGTIDLSDIELGADAHYVFELTGGPQPYLGAGLGVHLLNGQGEAIDGTFVEDLLDTLAPGLNLLAGVSLPIGSDVETFAEARFSMVADIRYAGFTLGGLWRLPSPPRQP